ncbi:MAG: hypothetical protein R2698_09850 [Microthrixaceae bacterium]
MSFLLQRRLRSVARRLAAARADLAVTEEQLVQLAEDADFSSVDALVRDEPAAGLDATEARRHHQAMLAHRQDLTGRIERLERQQDELLDRWKR